MSTAIRAAQAVINEAFADLGKRIKSGKLKPTHKNGALLVGRAKETLKDISVQNLPTAKQLADAFYTAIRDLDFAATLDWEVLPAALAKSGNQGGPAKFGDHRATEDLSKRMADAHKADEKIRKQEAAKKACLALIDAFCPVDKRGNIRYTVQAEHRADWHKRLAKATNFMALEANIRAEMKKIYEELERPVLVGGQQ